MARKLRTWEPRLLQFLQGMGAGISWRLPHSRHECISLLIERKCLVCVLNVGRDLRIHEGVLGLCAVVKADAKWSDIGYTKSADSVCDLLDDTI